MTAEDQGAQRLDIRRHNMLDVKYHTVSVPLDTAASIAKMVNSYNLRFAAVDMVIDSSGRWLFLEINPNGQWAWLDLVGATDLAADFVEVFDK